MEKGLNVGLHIRLSVGYLLGAWVIIPLVMFGVSLLSKLQVWTQPPWLVMMLIPLIAKTTAEVVLPADPNKSRPVSIRRSKVTTAGTKKYPPPSRCRPGSAFHMECLDWTDGQISTVWVGSVSDGAADVFHEQDQV